MPFYYIKHMLSAGAPGGPLRRLDEPFGHNSRLPGPLPMKKLVSIEIAW
jgi:hypothetical protein